MKLAGQMEHLESRRLLAGVDFTTTVGVDPNNAGAVAATPDGKILVARIGFLHRYDALTGAPDLIFGNGDGVVELINPIIPTIVDMEVDASGKIYIAGTHGGSKGRRFGVARLNADGSADTSFGVNGLALVDFVPSGVGAENLVDLDISSTGRIALVGDDGRSSVVLAVLTSAGALDTTFDRDGKIVWGVRTDEVTTVQGQQATRQHLFTARAVDFAPDGHIIVGGTSDIHLLLPPGVTVDQAPQTRWQLRSFSPTGQQVWSKDDLVDENSAIHVADLDVLPDGSILVAGGFDGLSLRKIAPNGAIDLTFPRPPAGYSAPPINGQVTRIAATADGHFFLLSEAVTSADGGTGRAVSVSRFLPHGLIDPNFGTRGVGTAPGGAPVDLIALGNDPYVVAGINALQTLTLRHFDADSALPQVFITRNGTLKIIGGEGNDQLHVHGRNDGRVVVTVNGVFRRFHDRFIRRVHIYGLGSADRIDVGTRIGGVYIEGGEGDDYLAGGYENDTILGGAGSDSLFGISGDDLMFGNGGRDYLNGSSGNDTLFGQAGIDTLSGASGNDVLIGGTDARDNIYGGAGIDIGQPDDKDNFIDIELTDLTNLIIN